MNYSSITVQKQYGNLSVFVEVLMGEEKRGESGEFIKVKESLIGNISSIQYLSNKNWIELPKDINEILEKYKILEAEKRGKPNAQTV